MQQPDAPSPQRPPSLLERLRRAPVTVALFAICVVVFVAAERSGSTRENATLLQFGAAYRPLVWAGQWWRLVTAMFLHIGPLHLFWNLVMGFGWCSLAEGTLGSPRFLLLYLASGVAGVATSVIGHEAVSAGASSALFGIIGMVFVAQRLAARSWADFWAVPGNRSFVLNTALWFGLGLFMNFDNYAHAGGFVAGAALAWSFAPRPGSRGLLFGTLLAIAGLALAATGPLPWLHSRPG